VAAATTKHLFSRRANVLALQDSQIPLVDIDPASPDFREDPYVFYSRLRKKGRVHYYTQLGSYWFIGHSGASNILTDKRFRKNLGPALATSRRVESAQDALMTTMLFMDPPDHTRLRGLVNKAFTPKMVEAVKPRVKTIADELLAKVEDSGRFDVISDFSFPLPALVIAEILGVPAEDRVRFKEWSDRIIQSLDATLPPEEHRAAYKAQLELAHYFSDLIESRRVKPKEDLLSGLIRVQEEGDRLSPNELLGMCILLLVAGHETTTNLIGNGFYALLRHPLQLSLLHRDRSLMPLAVEELLRFEPPVQRTVRVASEELELEGVKLARGDLAVAVIGAANRDPEVFENPDILNVARQNNHHLSFGKGIHFCLGAPLARLEANIAFNALLDKFPKPELIRKPEWKNNTLIRGLKSLEVAAS
jgi:pimeloyl-[acyl-carrier protein] synthase